MNKFLQIYQTTENLFNHLQAPPTDDDVKREEYINKIDELLQEREWLLDGYIPDENIDRKQVDQLLDWSEMIDNYLIQFKNEIGQEIKSFHQKKNSQQKYMNPYQNASFDGMYYDKKK